MVDDTAKVKLVSRFTPVMLRKTNPNTGKERFEVDYNFFENMGTENMGTQYGFFFELSTLFRQYGDNPKLKKAGSPSRRRRD